MLGYGGHLLIYKGRTGQLACLKIMSPLEKLCFPGLFFFFFLISFLGAELTSHSPGVTCPRLSPGDPVGSSEPPGLEENCHFIFLSILREASSLRPMT
jgi:hypothetical protein